MQSEIYACPQRLQDLFVGDPPFRRHSVYAVQNRRSTQRRPDRRDEEGRAEIFARSVVRFTEMGQRANVQFHDARRVKRGVQVSARLVVCFAIHPLADERRALESGSHMPAQDGLAHPAGPAVAEMLPGEDFTESGNENRFLFVLRFRFRARVQQIEDFGRQVLTEGRTTFFKSSRFGATPPCPGRKVASQGHGHEERAHLNGRYPQPIGQFTPGRTKNQIQNTAGVGVCGLQTQRAGLMGSGADPGLGFQHFGVRTRVDVTRHGIGFLQ